MKLRIADCKLPIGMAVLIIASTAMLHADEIIDRVLAIVGGEMVTLTDVTAARDFGLVDATAGDDVQAILPRLIDRELILLEVDRYAPPEPTPDALDAQVAARRARFPGEQPFQAALTRSGISESHLRETLRQDLRIQTYLDQRFAVPPPSDEELGRYYQEHRQAFTRGGEAAPFDAVRTQVALAAINERRGQLIGDWLTGLRRRTDILDLSAPAR